MEKVYLFGIIVWLVIGFIFSILMYRTYESKKFSLMGFIIGTIAGFLTLTLYYDTLHKIKTGIDMKETGITSSVRENLKNRGIL